jgi:Zn-dependent peptidase ImmA (M78 family)
VKPSLQTVMEGLEVIWAPGVEAMRVHQSLAMRSLADLSAAVQRAGYEICWVDLPEKISGFAKVIEGQPHIVLNRAKSAEHQKFTIIHELAHHVLHLGASQAPQLGSSSEGTAEFQAHQFATLFLLLLANDKNREEVLNQNPEWLLIGAASLFMTAGVIAAALIGHLWSYLSQARLPRPGVGK